MKKLIVSSLVLASILLTACGGGGASDNTRVNGDGTVSQGGSVTGGTSKIPSSVGVPCKSTTKIEGEDADITIITEEGATGSITIDCDKTSRGFQLKENVPNLNIRGASVVDYWFCTNKQGKGLLGWLITHDLTKGRSKMVWSEQGKAYINCHSNYPSPLPKTVSSGNDIEELSNYWSDQNVEFSNCTYSTQTGSTNVSCENISDRLILGTNTTLIDSNGKVHKTSERTTFITKKH